MNFAILAAGEGSRLAQEGVQLPKPLVRVNGEAMIDRLIRSFYELRQIMPKEKFCMTTVDTIFREGEFEKYIRLWAESDADGMMAVTDYVDDEKPLYISTDSEMRITGFHDSERQTYISGGIY